MTGFDRTRPRAAQQLVAAEHAAAVLEEERHQPELRRRELDRPIVDPQTMTCLVQHQRTRGQLIRPRTGRGAAQAGIDPRDELHPIEWNRETVIHAKLERVDGVVDVRLVRPDDYTALTRGRLLAKAVERVAQQPMLRPLDQQQIGLSRLRYPHARRHIRGLCDRVACGFQRLARQLARQMVAVDDKHCITHRWPSPYPGQSNTGSLQCLYVHVTTLLNASSPAPLGTCTLRSLVVAVVPFQPHPAMS